jgi:hypothetical protein
MYFHSRFIEKNSGSGNGSKIAPDIVSADAGQHREKPCQI